MELDRDIKRWFLVPNVVARRKVGQALRENNTEEARAAKRAKYQGRLNSKKSLTGTENGIAPVIDINNSTSTGSVVAMDTTGSNAQFPTTNAFPIDDAESSNRVAV